MLNQSSEVISMEYYDNNNKTLIVDFSVDAWVNASKVFKNFKKDINKWMSDIETIEYSSELIDEINNYDNNIDNDIDFIDDITELYNSELIIKKSKKNIWLHPELSMYMAKCLSIKFGRWCDKKINEIINNNNNNNNNNNIATKEDLNRMVEQLKPVIKFQNYEPIQKKSGMDIRQFADTVNEMELFEEYLTIISCNNILRDMDLVNYNNTNPTAKAINNGVLGLDCIPIVYEDGGFGKSIKTTIYLDSVNYVLNNMIELGFLNFRNDIGRVKNIDLLEYIK